MNSKSRYDFFLKKCCFVIVVVINFVAICLGKVKKNGISMKVRRPSPMRVGRKCMCAYSKNTQQSLQNISLNKINGLEFATYFIHNQTLKESVKPSSYRSKYTTLLTSHFYVFVCKQTISKAHDPALICKHLKSKIYFFFLNKTKH